MGSLRPQVREPVTFFQRVLYSDAFDAFLGGTLTVLSAGLAFWGVCLLIGFALNRGHNEAERAPHAEATATAAAVDPVPALNTSADYQVRCCRDVMRNLEIVTAPGPQHFDAVIMSDGSDWLRVNTDRHAAARAPDRKQRSRNDVTAIGQVIKDVSDGERDREFCAHHCEGADACYAVWLEHAPSHMKAVLPCVDGKVGVWEISRL